MRKENIKKILTNPLVITWLIVQICIVMYYGIYSQQEAIKYITEAAYIQQHHHFSEPKYLFYSSYILLHILMNILGIGLVGVYLVQLCFNALATYFFHKLIVEHANIFTANATTFLLIIFIPYQAWTAHLYTENLFCSSIILLTFFFLSKRISLNKKLIYVPLFLVLTVLSRPTGLLFIPILFFAILLSNKWLSRFYKYSLALLVLILFTAILQFAMYGKGEFNFLKPLVQEHIICGMPTNSLTFIEHEKNDNTLVVIVQYTINNLSTIISLFLKRLLAFWGLYRSYFSWKHNIMLAIFFYPVYLMFLLGLKQMFVLSKTKFYFCLLAIFFFSLSVAITCDDWHNRFIMPIVPLLLLGSSVAINKIYVYSRTLGSIKP